MTARPDAARAATAPRCRDSVKPDRMTSARTGLSALIVMPAVSYAAGRAAPGYPAVLCAQWCSGSAGRA